MRFGISENAIHVLKIGALAIVLHIFMLLANSAFNHNDTLTPTKVMYKPGDDPSWASMFLVDDSWSTTKPGSSNKYWLRAHFDFNNRRFVNRKKVIKISLLGSYEAYYNGVLIGTNGSVGGDYAKEVAGYLDRKIILPNQTTNGGNGILALRVSDYLRNTDLNHLELVVDSYNEFYNYGMVLSLLVYNLSGLFLTVALYYFFLFFISRRRPAYLIFGIFCIVLFTWIIQNYSRLYWPYLYTQYRSWLFISNLLSLSAAILLPIFFVNTFEVPKKQEVLIVSIFVVLMSYFVFTTDKTAPLFISVSISTIITIWAIFKKRLGSWESLTGLLIFLIGMMYFNLSIFVGFGVLVIANLFLLSVIQKEEKRQFEESLLRSSRLKHELLKKHLKPHFLMNTLTNIVSLIKSEPNTSVKLIEALSEEFYSLNEMTDKKLIPLEKELRLCRAHLEVMSIRNDVMYAIDTKIVDSNIKIPPAILHTLLENGVTHCDAINGKVQFDLKVEVKEGTTSIHLSVNGKFSSKFKTKEGTGMAYIRSRLQESFPKKWVIKYGEVEKNIWFTNIEFSK